MFIEEIDNDQRNGGNVDVIGSVKGVSVFSSGMRNAFDCVVTMTNSVWCTDNGPNSAYGLASTGPNTQTTSGVQDVDEICEMIEGDYYGHPNRNRGIYDPREYEYHAASASPNSEKFTKCITVASALTGITEYQGFYFGGALRGDIFAQRWKAKQVHRVTIPEKEHSKVKELTPMHGLDLTYGPGGAFYGTVWSSYGQEGFVRIAYPDDSSLVGSEPRAMEVYPHRCAANTRCRVLVSGINLQNVKSVNIAGATLDISYKANKRIVGIVNTPPSAVVDGSFRDVTLNFGTNTVVLPNSFKWVKK